MLFLFSSLPSQKKKPSFCPSFPQALDRWLTCYLSQPWCHAYEADHYMLLKHWSNAFSDTATSNYAGSDPLRAGLHHESCAPLTNDAWFTLEARGWVHVSVCACVCIWVYRGLFVSLHLPQAVQCAYWYKELTLWPVMKLQNILSLF